MRFTNLHFLSRIPQHLQELDGKLKGLCFSGKLMEAVDVLCSTGLEVDPQSYALVLQDCIYRKEFKSARRLHGHMIVVGFTPDDYLTNKLVILHSKSGDLEAAHYVFDKIPNPDMVSWNTMIAGYVQKGFEEMGLDFYYKMRLSGLVPDQFTFASVFRACASVASLEQGRRIHGVMLKSNISSDNVVVNSALMDMYFKCSSIYDAHKVFDKAEERNVITWTSMICGYGQHGRVREVLELFHRMLDAGFRPNYITFLAVFSACSHGGLVNEGWKYFTSMTRDFGIKPRGKHYAAMVDLLGRAGKVKEAYEFVKSSPCKEHSTVWGALLGACRIHGDLELVQIVAEKFFELEPQNAGKYIVLSNAYAASGLWKKAREVREEMSVSKVKKEPACSWIEVQREVHIFLVADKYHRKSEQIYEMIKDVTCILKDAGYVPDLGDGEAFMEE